MISGTALSLTAGVTAQGTAWPDHQILQQELLTESEDMTHSKTNQMKKRISEMSDSYQPLKGGDIRKEGDQWRIKGCLWKDVDSSLFGYEIAREDTIACEYRRPLTLGHKP